ncbi:MAG: hypothetical protein KC561_14640 [Myxococcales bacterium]|nr:hypothetical protein [Myxococcales bacterium]
MKRVICLLLLVAFAPLSLALADDESADDGSASESGTLDAAQTWLSDRTSIAWLVYEPLRPECRLLSLSLASDGAALAGALKRVDGMEAQGWVGGQTYEFGTNAGHLSFAGPQGHCPGASPSSSSGVAVSICPLTIPVVRALAVEEVHAEAIAFRETAESFDQPGIPPLEWWFSDIESCEEARASGDPQFVRAIP